MKNYTTQIYTQIDDQLEAAVLAILMENAGEQVSRQKLIFRVFGLSVKKDGLIYSTEDRQVREAIRRLQLKEFPIVSSSRSAGYTLATEETRIDECVSELQSRRNSLDEKIGALRRARCKLPAIRAARHEKAEQINLFT